MALAAIAVQAAESGPTAVTYGQTFVEGLLSFLAPCVLPLVPGYLSFVSGISIARVKKPTPEPAMAMAGASGSPTTPPANPAASEPALTITETSKVLISTLIFIAGFTTAFVALFAFTYFFYDTFGDGFKTVFLAIAGVVVIIFGLNFLGVFRIGFLNMEKRFNMSKLKPASYFGAYLLGLAFAVGWSPCVGPFLGAAISTSLNGENWEGASLIVTYSAGLGIPFIFAGLFFSRFLGFIARVRRHFRTIEIASGVLLIIVGILLLTGQMTKIAEPLAKIRFF